ncbi:MAG: hypothetical protein KDD21_01370 [Bacteroidetes bacterium]|nr:hypothetical protein [Bacteroidota bacterium]
MSIFASGCIPNLPVGGIPTPQAQTDTTVVYRLLNKVVVDYNQTTNITEGIPIDIDSNGVNDLHFDSYNGNYGYGTANIYSYEGTELADKKDTSVTNSFRFIFNDVIDNTYFASSWLPFHSGYNTNGSQTLIAGFRLILNDGLHYGWIQLKRDVTFGGIPPWTKAQTIKLTVINYAYKKAPNVPIHAGKY